MTRELTTTDAMYEAIAEEMRRDSRVYLMGEGVGLNGVNVVRSPDEICKEFGEYRVRETGIIEPTLAGSALGAALTGSRPIIDFMMADFFSPAWSEIYDAGLWRAGHGAAEDMKVPVVFIGGIISYSGGGFSHSRAPIGNVWHGPGLKLVIPTTPYDAKGLLKTAIRDDNPVVFLVHRFFHNLKGDVPIEEYLIPFGQAVVRREGTDVTVVADGYGVTLSLEAADELAKEGVSVEVIDPRTLEPLDIDSIIASVKKTGRVVIVDEDNIRCGPHAEVAFQVQEKALKFLKAPIQRVGNPNMPIPLSMALQKVVMPTRERIIESIKRTVK